MREKNQIWTSGKLTNSLILANIQYSEVWRGYPVRRHLSQMPIFEATWCRQKHEIKAPFFPISASTVQIYGMSKPDWADALIRSMSWLNNDAVKEKTVWNLLVEIKNYS